MSRYAVIPYFNLQVKARVGQSATVSAIFSGEAPSISIQGVSLSLKTSGNRLRQTVEWQQSSLRQTTSIRSLE